MHHHDQIISDLRSRADAHAGVAVPWDYLAIIHKCSVDRLKRKCVSWLALIFLTHLDVAELFFSLSFSDSRQAHAPSFIHLISLEVQRACVPSCPFEYNFTAALSNRFRIGRGTRFAAVGIQSAETSQIMSTAHDTQSLFFAWQFFTHAWAAKFIRNRERERPNRTGEKMQCDHFTCSQSEAVIRHYGLSKSICFVFPFLLYSEACFATPNTQTRHKAR